MSSQAAWLRPFEPLSSHPPLAGVFELVPNELVSLQQLRQWRYGGRKGRYEKSRNRLLELIDPLRYCVVQVRNEVTRYLYLTQFSNRRVLALRTHVTTPSFLVGGRRVKAAFPLVALHTDGVVVAHAIADYVDDMECYVAIATALGWTLQCHLLVELKNSRAKLDVIARQMQLLTVHIASRPAEATHFILDAYAKKIAGTRAGLIGLGRSVFGLEEGAVEAVLTRLVLSGALPCQVLDK